MAINVANNQSLTAITALPSAVTGGAMTLLTTETASSSATITFDSNIDDTYDEYVFKFYDINPGTNDVNFQVNFRDGSTAYDATKTTTFFRALHNENGATTALAYRTGDDVAQGTGVQKLGHGIGSVADESLAGTLTLYAPSNTTFVKHFIATTNINEHSDVTVQSFIAGYCNVTAAIDGVQFSMSSGNFDGVIKLYGVS